MASNVKNTQKPPKADTTAEDDDISTSTKATNMKENDKKSKNSESKEDPNDLGEWEEKVKEAGALPGKANVRHKAHPFGDRTKHRYFIVSFSGLTVAKCLKIRVNDNIS